MKFVKFAAAYYPMVIPRPVQIAIVDDRHKGIPVFDISNVTTLNTYQLNKIVNITLEALNKNLNEVNDEKH